MNSIEKISPLEERFERIRRTSGFFIGPAVFFTLLLIPMPGIPVQAHTLSAILALVVIWWITESIPIPVSALLGTSLCVVLGVETAKAAFAPFGDPIIFLFVGSFILAQAMRVHRLDRRIAFMILSWPWIGKSSLRVLFAFGLIAVFISMWISNTATTAMLFPIGLGILSALTQIHKRESTHLKYSTAMMLMAAYGASVGGIGTPVGTPPNLIGIGLISRLIGIKISFFKWMVLGVPLLIVMYGVLFLLLCLLFPPEFRELPGIDDYLGEERQKMGKMSQGEKNVLIAFLCTVVLWICPGIVAIVFGAGSKPSLWCEAHIPEALAAVIGAALLFFLPISWKERTFTMSWKNAVDIDWGTIILFGGGLSLGSLMFSTHLAEHIGTSILALTGARTVFAITAVSVGLAIISSELTSNTASANMVIPIMISLSVAAGVNPLPPALGACLGASYGFMLPVSTPPNAIIYGSGLVPITRMIRAGIFFDVVGFLIILFGVFLLLPIVGL